MTDNELKYGMLVRKIERLRASAKADLSSNLKVLKQRVEQALEALDNNKPLDSHIITNHEILTAEIERWNIAIDLEPLL